MRLFSIETRLRLTTIATSTPTLVVAPSAAPPATAKERNRARELERADDELNRATETDAAKEASPVVSEDACEAAKVAAPNAGKKRQRATNESGRPKSIPELQSKGEGVDSSKPSPAEDLPKENKRKKKEKRQGRAPLVD